MTANIHQIYWISNKRALQGLQQQMLDFAAKVIELHKSRTKELKSKQWGSSARKLRK